MVRVRRWSALFVVVLSFILCLPARSQVGLHSKKYRDAVFPPAAGALTTTTTPGPDNTLGFVYQDFGGTTFPPPGWTSQGNGWAIWIRSTDASGYGIGTGSALASFFDVQSGSFSLVSPTFAAAVAGDSLRFDHAYCTYQTENDQLQISTSTDGGVNWTLLVTLDGGVNGPLATAPPDTNAFLPSPSQWATKSYGLPVGTNKARFTAISAFGNNLYIDNISVGTPFTNDVGVTSIDIPRSNIAPGSYTPMVTIRNFGTMSQSFGVELKITPTGYDDSTQIVSNLAPGAAQQVTFSDWVTSVGSDTLQAFTRLESDSNHTNDTLTSFNIVSDVNRTVLLEFATGTWCQWCPCSDSVAERLLRSHPDLVVLAYHGYVGSSDPYTNFNGNDIVNRLSFTAYPTAMFDRQNAPADYTTWSTLYQNRSTNFAPTPITITAQTISYNDSTRLLNATIDLTSNCDLPFQYKVNYVITEDSLIFAQAGNTECPGDPGWIHNRVVRSMVNGALGENVNPTSGWPADSTITKIISTTLSPAWVSRNCRLNIFVYKDTPFLGIAEVQNAIAVTLTGITDVRESTGGGQPITFDLSQNYPNPFNPETNIKFSVPNEGFVSLKVFDITGKEVLTGVNEVLRRGFYNLLLDASHLSSGVYFYRLSTNGFSKVMKMVLIK